jgi:hypothetical protein
MTIANPLSHKPCNFLRFLQEFNGFLSSFLHVYHAFAVDLNLMEAAFWLLDYLPATTTLVPHWFLVWAFSGVAKRYRMYWPSLRQQIPAMGIALESYAPECCNCSTRVFHIPFNALFNVARTQSKEKQVSPSFFMVLRAIHAWVFSTFAVLNRVKENGDE